ncbi:MULTISPECIES: HlyD family secretion protein [unclassified Mesorhizobium]|uniref:efflux RND transporter periplasmic adaptor subunit n=1 Tax=unclassified Mesorhizobium TaxID=325217 RepID=UPI001FED7431|nr:MULTISPECIES: HlyD family secretion protein [unclassified Mesorhizobium]
METQLKMDLVRETPAVQATESPSPPSTQTEGAAPTENLYLLAPAPPQDRAQTALVPQGGPVQKRHPVQEALLATAKRLATLVVALAAVLVSLLAWDHYLTAPWTRDGRVRVQVASVAPEVSGRIKDLHVADNQFVHKGDLLYVIDPFDFNVALRTSRATLQQRAADLQVKERQSERQRKLSSVATTPEQQQIYAGNAIQAEAAFEAAQQQVAQADINLKRTEVRSPVNGYVTNLLLRAGDYARQGITNVSIIDTDSFWIDGYFEETKMARVCTGARVEAKLIGYQAPIIGHVNTITRGLSVANATAGAQGLPNVDPIYTWVRLAQRVPVRIAIDEVPPGVPLVSGMTATVTVRDASDRSTWFDRAQASVLNVLDGPSVRPDCVATAPTDGDPSQSVPAWEAEAAPEPEQINPGLATGIQMTPATISAAGRAEEAIEGGH